MSYGTCKICGCTDDNPCVHPDFGSCFWVDKTHELCSHCIELPGNPVVKRLSDFNKSNDKEL